MNYVFHLLVYFGVYAILAMGLNLIVDYCGLLSLSHAGYFVVGACAYALEPLAWGLDSLAALLLAFLAGGVLSLLTSLPTWRLKGDYSVMASMAVQVLLYSTAYNWGRSEATFGMLANLTNGPFGIAGVSRPVLFGAKLSSLGAMAAFSIAVAAVCMGNLKGPLAGAAILLLIPEILRFINVPDPVAVEIRVMLYGLMLVLVVRFKPEGMAGDYKVN